MAILCRLLICLGKPPDSIERSARPLLTLILLLMLGLNGPFWGHCFWTKFAYLDWRSASDRSTKQCAGVNELAGHGLLGCGKNLCLHDSVERFLKGSWNAIER